MTLRQLEMFVAIVETGSFSQAAAKLYVAQPSLSQQIRTLEEELGEQLLIRMRNKKMHLTEAGKIMKPHAESILRQAQILKMEISSLTAEPSGEIHIGVGGHQLTSILAPVLRNFHASFPKVRVDILNATTPQIVQLLTTNALDIGIVTFPLQSKELRTELLFSEELVLVVARGHHLTRKQAATPADIHRLPLVLYDGTTGTRARIDDFFRNAGIAPSIVLELSSVEAMASMVEAGLGATIIPESAFMGAAARRKLRALHIDGRPLVRDVGLALTHVSRMPRVIDEMIGLVKDRFHQFGSRSA